MLIYLGFTFWVYMMVVLYPLVDLGYIRVASMNLNERFKAVAHCPVFSILGKREKKNSVDPETITEIRGKYINSLIRSLPYFKCPNIGIHLNLCMHTRPKVLRWPSTQSLIKVLRLCARFRGCQLCRRWYAFVFNSPPIPSPYSYPSPSRTPTPVRALISYL